MSGSCSPVSVSPSTAAARDLALQELDAASEDAATATRRSLLGLTLNDLRALTRELELSDLRAEQLCTNLFARRQESFDAMVNMTKTLRLRLAAHFDIGRPRIDSKHVARDGTRKYRFVARDGTAFEAVYIPEIGGKRANTLCVSSQSGCAVGCKFCFTASLRRNRNLTAGEIVGQVMAVQADVASLGQSAQVTNIVFMGMGEPLLNYAHVVQASRVLLEPAGMCFSRRRVTVSTSGIVPRIRQLGRDLPVQLAISLNATTDAVRSRIMPINKKWPLAELTDALRHYPLEPGRTITIEYVLLGGINDSQEDARRLAELLQGIPAKVNLLPLNPHDRTEFIPPAEQQVRLFQAEVRQAGLHALVRTPRGQEIGAACGQLGESSLASA